MYARGLTFIFVFQLYKKNPLTRGELKLSSDGSDGKLEGEPNTALLSTILVLGTFFVAFYMRKFRTSHFFGKRVSKVVLKAIALLWTCLVRESAEKTLHEATTATHA